MDLEKQKAVASNMRHLRLVSGHTQAEIADALHICRTTYTLYELGKKIPTTDTLIDLASYYQIHLDLLLDVNAGKYISLFFSRERSQLELLQLIKTFHCLSPASQGKLMERAAVLLELETSQVNKD
ncbi:MAG: helix-turn-helix transcriptional regulator [Firmicutes bacterium]|nr:helix-turn-helix transcriptional regulator [Bacillota bacterium]